MSALWRNHSTRSEADTMSLAKSEADGLEALAQKIIGLKERYGKNIVKDFLACKWSIGREICQTRLTTDASYRQLERLARTSYEDLRCCEHFYDKYPKQDYELKAWRRHVAELPQIEEAEEVETTAAPVLDGKYGTIYADPPWPYDNQSTRAATSNHYKTLTVDDICGFKVGDTSVGDLAAPESHLHLWTTNAFLFEAKRVLEAWGFEYKSVFVWVKPQMGIGNYWRVSHEFLILGVKGGLTFKNHNAMSWMRHDRLGYSEKPDAVRLLIEEVSPAPRLELFGRKHVEGWTVCGDEVPALVEMRL